MNKTALEYVRKGWPVLALHSLKDGKCTCNKKKCDSPGKHPRWHKTLLPHGVKSATIDETIIKKWWSMWPDANIGIAAGPQTFDVLDVDIDKDTGEEIGEAALAEIEERNNDKLPYTIEQITGSGGRQIFFKYTGKIKKNESRFADGLDNRTLGGYVVAPPSLHISGKRYEWEAAHHPDETGLAEPPGWLIDLINSNGRLSRKEAQDIAPKNKPDWVQEALLGVKEGSRDRICTKLAGYYLRLFKGDKQQVNLILYSWNKRNESPMDQGQVEKCVNSVASTAAANKNIPKTTKKPTQTETLLKEIGAADLFHTADNNVYAKLRIDNHYETWNVRAKPFKNWLQNSFYKKEGKSPSAQAMADALNTIEGIGQFDRPQREVYLRMVEKEGTIYLDLSNDHWEVVEISETGWKIIKESPVYFRRTKGMLPLPYPDKEGSIEELRPFLNLPKNEDEATWRLFVGWLLQACTPQGPYPILVLNGEQGTAKSTISRFLRLLVDPSLALLRTISKDERDLAVTANNNWVLNFDNLSKMPAWVSDALCRISTGGGFATRELYTNDDEFICNFMRPIILNGIDDIIYRHDLADRTIFITLPPIRDSARIRESELMAKFSTVQSRIFGSMLTALSVGLKNIKKTHLAEIPRMADFAHWVQAMEPGLPWESGGFLQVYHENRQQIIEQAIESDSVASAVARLIRTIDDERMWEGSPNDLLIELDEREPENVKKQKYWPKNASALSRRLKRASSFLRKVGINVEIGKAKGKRFFQIYRIGS